MLADNAFAIPRADGFEETGAGAFDVVRIHH
jgi:hypothetical protein